jgi:hypothetical protein
VIDHELNTCSLKETSIVEMGHDPLFYLNAYKVELNEWGFAIPVLPLYWLAIAQFDPHYPK